MTRVVFWANIPSPYMVDRFNAVAARGKIEFEAWFSARTESGRSWNVDEARWHFLHRYLPAVDRGTSALALPTPLLCGDVPDLFVSLYAGADFLAGSAVARRRGAHTAFWVVVTYDAWERRRWWKEALKSHAFPRADSILRLGPDGASMARPVLRPGPGGRAGIHTVPYVIDFNHFARGSHLSPHERERVRFELVLSRHMATHEGYPVKALVVGASHDTQVPYERSLYTLCKRRGLEIGRDVVFVGGLDDVRPALAAADISVLSSVSRPKGVPIAADEAMGMRLPVISTDVASVSELVEDGLTGLLVRPLDARALARAIVHLADPAIRSEMGARGRKRAVSLCSAEQCARIRVEGCERPVERHNAVRLNGRRKFAAVHWEEKSKTARTR